MSWIKLLSLVAVVAALFAANGLRDRGPALTDRIELPAGTGDADDGFDGDVALDLLLPPTTVATPLPIFAGRTIVEPRTTPATSDTTSRIFRPPMRVRA
ncbi:MAG TPA: hypothetical protein VHJ20_08260 [Polyangia bacterium]|nr:hypothetical protein [Polyangia bacterium]